MYKVLNWLFGWDYIQWKNFADTGISRVFIDGGGRVVYWRYRVIQVMDKIGDPKEVFWLTCKPEKYFNNGGNDARNDKQSR